MIIDSFALLNVVFLWLGTIVNSADLAGVPVILFVAKLITMLGSGIPKANTLSLTFLNEPLAATKAFFIALDLLVKFSVIVSLLFLTLLSFIIIVFLELSISKPTSLLIFALVLVGITLLKSKLVSKLFIGTPIVWGTFSKEIFKEVFVTPFVPSCGFNDCIFLL